MSTVIAVVGPTAAGKTALSIDLAEALGGEIVSADSRQVYRGLDIGTAKASAAERQRVPHHLLDIVDPDEVLTLAEYLRQAQAAIADIHARGRPALLTGGTGQYVRAVLEGWRIPAVAPDRELRAALEKEARDLGSDALHARLAVLDPVAAARIDRRNVRRVIRALEVCIVTGRSISELQAKSPPSHRILRIGVTRPRAELRSRIEARVAGMIASGLVDEVRRLAEAGYGWDLPALSGLGYRQIGACLRGEMAFDTTVAEIVTATWRFVQQQYNWFRLDDPDIRWIDPGAAPWGAAVRDMDQLVELCVSAVAR